MRSALAGSGARPARQAVQTRGWKCAKPRPGLASLRPVGLHLLPWAGPNSSWPPASAYGCAACHPAARTRIHTRPPLRGTSKGPVGGDSLGVTDAPCGPRTRAGEAPFRERKRAETGLIPNPGKDMSPILFKDLVLSLSQQRVYPFITAPPITPVPETSNPPRHPGGGFFVSTEGYRPNPRCMLPPRSPVHPHRLPAVTSCPPRTTPSDHLLADHVAVAVEADGARHALERRRAAFRAHAWPRSRAAPAGPSPPRSMARRSRLMTSYVMAPRWSGSALYCCAVAGHELRAPGPWAGRGGTPSSRTRPPPAPPRP